MTQQPIVRVLDTLVDLITALKGVVEEMNIQVEPEPEPEPEATVEEHIDFDEPLGYLADLTDLEKMSLNILIKVIEAHEDITTINTPIEDTLKSPLFSDAVARQLLDFLHFNKFKMFTDISLLTDPSDIDFLQNFSYDRYYDYTHGFPGFKKIDLILLLRRCERDGDTYAAKRILKIIRCNGITGVTI